LIWRSISTTPSLAFRDRGRVSAEHGSGGVLRVDGVVLAAQPPVAAIGAQHLDDADVPTADRGGQTSTVGTGAFDGEGQLAAQADRPVDELGVAGPVRGEALAVDDSAELVEGDGHVDVLVGVDADDHPVSSLDDVRDRDHARHCYLQQTRRTVAVLAGRVDGIVTRLSAVRLL
jgi:hypothetical protein